MTTYTVTLYRGSHEISRQTNESLLQAARSASYWAKHGGEGYHAEVKLSVNLFDYVHSRRRGQPAGIMKRVRQTPR